MSTKVGLNEVLEHSVAGSTFAAFDQVTSGNMTYEGGDVQEEIGAGGQAIEYRDMVTPVGSANTVLQTLGLLACAKPAAVGSLPPIIAKIQGGPLSTTNRGRLHQSCYLRKVTIACSAKGVITVAYDWLALTSAKATIATAQAKQTNTTFHWNDVDTQFEALGYKAQSWSVELTNDIIAKTSLDLKAAGSQRLPEQIDPGNFSAVLKASLRIPLDVADDFIADYPTRFGFKVVAKNSDTVKKTFTLDMTGGSKLSKSGDPIEIVRGSEEVLYEVGGKILTNDLAAVVITLA